MLLDFADLFNQIPEMLFLGVTTLSFGFKKPQVGDIGDPIFDALEDTIDQLNSHDHDGTDSDRVKSYSLTRGSVSVPATGWSASGSLYRQSVTFPSGFSTANGSDWGSANIQVFFSGGTYDTAQCYPKMEKITATTFYLYSLVSNQAFTCKFG